MSCSRMSLSSAFVFSLNHHRPETVRLLLRAPTAYDPSLTTATIRSSNTRFGLPAGVAWRGLGRGEDADAAADDDEYAGAVATIAKTWKRFDSQDAPFHWALELAPWG